MQMIAPSPTRFWCPRCGTIVTTKGETEAPALVKRCTKYRGEVLDRPDVPGHQFRLDEWHRIGIDEATTLPTERPNLFTT
jgi:hypothetical protein